MNKCACVFFLLAACGGRGVSQGDSAAPGSDGSVPGVEPVEAGAPAFDKLDGGSCTGPDRFRFDDRSCNPTDGAMGSCTQEGDLRCYRRCEDHVDCPDPSRPYCSTQGLFDYGDWKCNSFVKICRDTSFDDC